MEPIRVVWGVGGAETAMAAYDAALAEAGVENYNLSRVSSVVPPGAEVRVVETAPDLGPVGGRLTVVQAHDTVPPGVADRACAGLGWAVADSGQGVFYEATGESTEAVRETVERGLDEGIDLRNWTPAAEEVRVAMAPSDPDSYTAAVVLAAYGRAEPVLSTTHD